MGGGIPQRKITEISGPWSIGKTTLALQIIARAQEAKKVCIWADIEWSFDEEGEKYAAKLGVDPSKLELIQAVDAETSLEEVVEWIRTKKNILVVIDAVGALRPRDEAEKEMGGKSIATQSRLVATFCRHVVPYLAINNNALIVLNHEFIPLMTTGRPVLMTSGGKKLEYAKSIWLKLAKAGKNVMQGDQKVGEVITAEVRKNKLAATRWQTCELTLLNGAGFSAEADLLQELLDSGEITKQGNTYFRGETKLGVGLAKAREALKSSLSSLGAA